MRCPGCDVELREARARARDPVSAELPVPGGEIVLDRCDACGGAWYDAGELSRVTGVGPESLRCVPEGPVRHTHCPVCRTPVAAGRDTCASCGRATLRECPRCGSAGLEYVRLAGFRLARCPRCAGLWVDRGIALAIAGALGHAEPDRPARGITCVDCGRTGLRAAETICTDAGLICDACAARRQDAGTADQGGGGAWHEDERVGTAVEGAAFVLEVLTTVLD